MIDERDLGLAIWAKMYVDWIEHYEPGPKAPTPSGKPTKVWTTPLPSNDQHPSRLLITDSAGNEYIVSVVPVKKRRGFLKRRSRGLSK